MSSSGQRQDKGLLDATLETGWLLAAVLAPLWINLWANRPFDPAKVALLRAIIWSMGGLWLAHALLTGQNPLRYLRRKRLLWPALGLALVLCAATIVAPDPYLSLFGSYTRAQGLLTQLSYLLLFLVVSSRLRTREQALRLAAAMALGAAPIILLGVAQAAGADPLDLVTDARSPVYATLGRANFVGAYLAMLLPLTLALLMQAHGRARRLAFAVMMLAQMALIALSASRASLLAAGAGLLTFAFLWRWPRLSLRRRRRSLILAFVALAAAVAGLLLAVTQTPSGSVAARGVIWEAVWALVRRRPLLGYGPDSLELVFPRVYPPQLVYYLGRDFFVDRAHNLLLDWAVTAGLLGLLALVVLWANALRIALRRLSASSSTRQLLLAAALAALAANLANNMVAFDVTATAVASWLLLALVVSPALAAQPLPAAQSDRSPARATWARRLAAGLLLAGVVVAVVQANARPLLADMDHRRAALHAALGNWEAAVAYARRAARRWPHEPQHRRLLGQITLGQARASGDARTLTRAEAAILAARDLRPLDVAGWSALGDFYYQTGLFSDAAALELAHDAYSRAVALAPHNARLYVAWARVYLAQERLDTAKLRLQRALALDATDGLAYRLLGDVLLASGDSTAAQENYQQARRWLQAP